ncbi:pyridoxamine 5'-phosphate oxidase family protein [Clostridioides difficile]
MEKIMNFLKENPTFYFATVEDNKPRVRPFGFVMDYEGRLYFGIGKHKASYKQLLSNPNVEISTANKEGKWIRIKGKAVFDENKDALKKAFEILPSLKKMYNEETGMSLGLIYLEDIDAEFADLMTGQFEKITL